MLTLRLSASFVTTLRRFRSTVPSLRRGLCALLPVLMCAALRAQAQVSYTTQGSTYTQNFDNLLGTVPANNTTAAATVLPAGWGFVESGANANTTLRVDNGSSGTGDTFLYGATGSDERAFGSYASGSLTSQYGVQFVNNSGSTITSFTVTYDGEQWKDGGSTAAVTNKLTFSYSLGATSLTSGTYINDTNLDFAALVNNTTADAAKDGNNAAFRTAGITKTVTGISWPTGTSLWLRWADINDPGNDDGLAIDNFSFTTPANCTQPATPTAGNNGPLNPGATLNLTTPTVAGATYSWTGPNSFTSTNQNPSIANVTAVAAGTYSVTISVSGCTSDAGQTSVTINSAPAITSLAPASQWAYPGQTPVFTVAVTGTPAPALQWRFNGADLPGEVNSNLTVSVTDTNAAGAYSVVASNALGRVTNTATLTVYAAKPNLRITEVMSSQFTNNLNGSTSNHGDWFELSNLGGFPVNLKGLRMDDNSLLLANSVTVTNDINIAPGESVVFIEVSGGNTPAQQVADFRTWWGLQNSNNVQIATYGGPGVGLSSAGDAVVVWNAAASSDADYLDRVIFAGATTGTSFGFDPSGGSFGGLSQAGVNGARVAPIGGDIGSPGTIGSTTPTAPVIGQPVFTAGNALLTFGTQPGFHYIVQYCTDLGLTNWVTLTNIPGTDGGQSFNDSSATNGARYYRVVATP